MDLMDAKQINKNNDKILVSRDFFLDIKCVTLFNEVQPLGNYLIDSHKAILIFQE